VTPSSAAREGALELFLYFRELACSATSTWSMYALRAQRNLDLPGAAHSRTNDTLIGMAPVVGTNSRAILSKISVPTSTLHLQGHVLLSHEAWPEDDGQIPMSLPFRLACTLTRSSPRPQAPPGTC
jgi:hypothetical protein